MGDDITIGVTEIVNNIEVTAQPNDQVIDISVVDNSDEVTLNVTPNVVEVNINKGSSFARWGTIYGNILDQTDLTDVLLSKADLVNGKVPSYQLPSFVDDVIEVANFAALPTVGEIGKIYITLDNNKIYRWSGSIYIEIASNQAIWGAITGTLSNQTDLQNALNAKANDDSVVKLTGNQSITGIKTFTTVLGNALTVNNPTGGWGQVINNTSTGQGLLINNSSTGVGLVFLSNGTSTGDIIWHQGIDGLLKFRLNSTGHVTANSFIKSGGTSAQILAADGSVITAGTNITISGGVISASGGGSTGSLEFNSTDLTVWNNGKGNIITNTSFGDGSLKSNTTGFQNTAYGFDSLQSNTTGNNNNANGFQSLKSNTTGNNNTANGFQSLLYNTIGSNNTANGLNALAANTTGSNNIAIGSDSGTVIADNTTPNLTGSNSIFIGPNTRPLADNQTNQIVIGSGTTGHGSNSVTLGNSSIVTTILRGNVGIGTTSPTVALDVIGNIRLSNDLISTKSGVIFRIGYESYIANGAINLFSESTTPIAFGNNNTERMRITSSGSVVVNNLGTGLVYSNAGALTSTNPSDERLKDEITDLQYGLNEILQLRPVSYNWKNDTINQGKQFGFIAQEVKEVMPELISEFTTIEDEEEVVRLGLDKEGIYATLVNAIKEQNEVLEQLKAEIELLKQK